MASEKILEAVDILVLSNGPGELATWVRPVVKAIRQQMGNDRDRVRISLILSPCPNASGQEARIAQTFPEIDRIQAADHFLPFLIVGKTAENWDWRDRGVVVFLGGDQFYPVVIGKRLGYRIVIYGEWETRWHRWVDRFGVMKPELIDRAPQKYAHKFAVVGDLMADVREGEIKRREGEKTGDKMAAMPPHATALPSPPHAFTLHSSEELIGLLPGSKPAKLAQGLPLALAIAQHIHAVRPQTRFVIPVAPTLDLLTLAQFANPALNPLVQKFDGVSAELVQNQGQPFLKTTDGLRVDLWTDFPAYDLLSQCRLCLTTVGANTAELGALAVPMIVLLPTQQLDAMRAWDGIPGLLAHLPGLGAAFATLINWWFLRKRRLLAWPNIWAGEAIVPELVGELKPKEVAKFTLNLLNHPEELEKIHTQLHQVRGQPGAAQQFAQLVQEAACQ